MSILLTLYKSSAFVLTILVYSNKAGRHVWCNLAGESVSRVWLGLQALGKELIPEIREIIHGYFEDPETLCQLTMKEVMEQIRQKRVILLDLRTTGGVRGRTSA